MVGRIARAHGIRGQVIVNAETDFPDERFRPGAPRLLALREKLGVSPDTIVVGLVAQLVPVKGHPTLIEALARVPGVHLWLAGKELDEKYAGQLRRRGRPRPSRGSGAWARRR